MVIFTGGGQAEQPVPQGDVEPGFRASAFNCPQPKCGAYAEMRWLELQSPSSVSTGLWRCTCHRCNKASFWLAVPEVLSGPGQHRMLWPVRLGGIPAHPEMPADVLRLYDEARQVAAVSPRAAVTLLRVAVDILLRHVVPDAGGKTLTDVVGLAVKQGLNPAVRAALDSLRVIGNDAVHPERLVLDEQDPSVKVTTLCKLLNLVVEQLISVPRLAAEMFESLPDGVRKSIERRDGGLPDFS
jgi:hypothetical protein